MIYRLFHPNPQSSKYYGILSDKVFNGDKGFGFVFTEFDEHCTWPVKASYHELVADGWRLLGEPTSDKERK